MTVPAPPAANDGVSAGCGLPCWKEIKRHLIDDHDFKYEEIKDEEGVVFARIYHPKTGRWVPSNKYTDETVVSPSIIDWVARRCGLTPKDLSLNDGTGIFVTVVPPPVKLHISSAAGHRSQQNKRRT